MIVSNIQNKNELQEVGISHIDEIFFTHFNYEIAHNFDKEIINDLIIDIFLTLTNLPEGVEHMKNKQLGKSIQIIESRLSQDEKICDRLFVIKNYLEI